jgi:hypothetical protein
MGYGFFAPGIVQGTTIYAVLTAIVAILAVTFARENKTTTKREAKTMAFVISITAGVCMWMFWLFTYMHQLVPLIYPIHTKVTA